VGTAVDAGCRICLGFRVYERPPIQAVQYRILIRLILIMSSGPPNKRLQKLSQISGQTKLPFQPKSA